MRWCLLGEQGTAGQRSRILMGEKVEALVR